MKTKKEYQKEIVALLKEIERIDDFLRYPKIDKDFKEFITMKKDELEEKIKDLRLKHSNTK